MESPASYPTWASIPSRPLVPPLSSPVVHWIPSSRYRKRAKDLLPSVARTSCNVFVWNKNSYINFHEYTQQKIVTEHLQSTQIESLWLTTHSVVGLVYWCQKTSLNSKWGPFYILKVALVEIYFLCFLQTLHDLGNITVAFNVHVLNQSMTFK